MKILALADEESAYLWDYFEKSKLEGIDLIISCGDLNPKYLSFLATFTNAPVIYVHGNSSAVKALTFWSPTLLPSDSTMGKICHIVGFKYLTP